MGVNVHPLFVHFPIALLTVYSLAELARFKRLQVAPYWFHVKAFLVIVGAIAAGVTLQTGSMAEGLLRAATSDQSIRHLVGVHSTWASFATGIYSLIALAYLITFLSRSQLLGRCASYKTTITLTRFSERLLASRLIILFALSGLVAIVITGALGGAIVYGPTTDPVVQFIYNALI